MLLGICVETDTSQVPPIMYRMKLLSTMLDCVSKSHHLPRAGEVVSCLLILLKGIIVDIQMIKAVAGANKSVQEIIWRLNLWQSGNMV